MKPVEILDSARGDRQNAIRFYADRSPNAPRQFRAELRQLLPHSERSGPIPVVHTTYRGALMKQFPYRIIFEELEASIEVNAIAHTSRLPEYWLRNR